MFISMKRSGYTKDGQQFAQGLFLILTQPKTKSSKYPYTIDVCSTCGRNRAEHSTPLAEDVQAISEKLHRTWMYLFTARKENDSEDLKDAVEVILEAQRRVEGCTYFLPTFAGYPFRAIVRHVSMSQFGQFMMGFARVHGERLTLSGSYGSDGLPTMVSDSVYERGLELPVELREEWNKGGGWNSAGSEASNMRKWALAHLAELRA